MLRCAGYSIMELMVVMVIVSVISAISVNGFNSYIADSQLEKSSWEILKELSGVRPIALKNDCTAMVQFTSATQFTISLDQNNDGIAQPGETFSTFTLPSNIALGLSSIAPTSAPTGASLPPSGKYAGSAWNTAMVVSKDAIGSINAGCLFIHSTRLKKENYCIVIAAGKQNFKMYKWTGSSWNAI